MTDNPKDVARFDAIGQRLRAFEDLRNNIGAFLADFALFESLYLTEALKAMSSDPLLVEYLPELMDLYYRLKLLKRLGAAKRLPEALQEDIAHVCKVGNVLRECRNDIAHGAAMLSAPFLTDPNTTDVVPGVQRPRSARVVPDKPISAGEVTALHREWMHDLPTIRKWGDIAVQLGQATHMLAQKLIRHGHGAPWEQLVFSRVEMPVRDKKASASARAAPSARATLKGSKKS